MLPSWRDRVTVLLHPRRLKIARVARGWRPQLVQKEIVDVAPAAPGIAIWQPVIDELGGLVKAGGLAGADVTLVLSSHFVRYTLAPSSELLDGESEEQLFARHCFAEVYGSAAEDWAVRVTPNSDRGPRLACAIDQAMIDAVMLVMAPLGRRFVSLQPSLMKSFNAWRSRIRNRSAWFVVAESGMLCLALLGKGRWQTVNTVKVGDAWPLELPFILERESSLCSLEEECSEVFLFSAEDCHTVIAESEPWRFENLRPRSMAGYADDTDAAFSIAVAG